MLIRKNTKAFKTIVTIITACEQRADRNKLVRLYITRAGHGIQDRINVEGIEGDTALFYEMNYQAIFNDLKSSNHQLHESDEVKGIYFFRSSNKAWDENPFEFDEAVAQEFHSLPELPAVRKKEKAQKFVLPSAKTQSDSPAPKSKETKKPSASARTEKSKPTKAVKPPAKTPRQPDFKLKRNIEFTDLGKIIYRQAQLDKEAILNYYHTAAEYLLPYLKDRPLWVRLHRDLSRTAVELTPESLLRGEDLPDWIPIAKVPEGKSQKEALLCNNMEHLLFYVEMGCLEFNPCHSRVKQIHLPDYIVIALESPESELTKAINAAITSKEILDGLGLPSFIRTDGNSGLHIYIPLDAKSEFEASINSAEYICKLMAMKAPGLVALAGGEEHVFGKVSLDYSLNEIGKTAVAPYSLIQGQVPMIATPLLWDEVNDGLRIENFNQETIFNRLKEVGDPFETLSRKKVNADELLERLENNYSFLF